MFFVDGEEFVNHLGDEIQWFTDKKIPIQDVRELIGSGNLHRLTWTISLRTLLGVLSKRTCFIAQADLWSPIVLSICEQLYKVDSLFKSLARPPCTDDSR